MHTPSSFEEVFVRRNALLLFLQRFSSRSRLTLAFCDRRKSTTARCAPPILEVSLAALAGRNESHVIINSECPDLEFCPLHDIFDEERACFCSSIPSPLVLYPKLYEGDRVVKGPDWQWGNQGDCGEGTVLQIKNWKDQINVGVPPPFPASTLGPGSLGQRRRERVSLRRRLQLRRGSVCLFLAPHPQSESDDARRLRASRRIRRVVGESLLIHPINHSLVGQVRAQVRAQRRVQIEGLLRREDFVRRAGADAPALRAQRSLRRCTPIVITHA